MKKQKYKGFTLVELIIVVTILAILATIAFISFQGYTKNTRDSNRLLTLKNLETGLLSYQIKSNNLYLPEDYTTITSSGGDIIGYQGYLGNEISRAIGMNEIPLDPLDKEKYVYSINLNKNKFQLLGYLESKDSISFIKNTYANSNYTDRIPTTIGSNLGIILDLDNNPISGTGINIDTYTGSLKVVLKDNYIVEGTGGELKGIKSTYELGKVTWQFIDPNCDKEDKVIGGQVWAGCNSTIGNGLDWLQTDVDIGTNQHNGVLNSNGCYDYKGHNDNTTCSDLNYMSYDKKENDWPLALNSGEYITDNIWGKLYTHNNLDSGCKNGRRTPTIDDYNQTLQGLGCVINKNSPNTLQCTNLDVKSFFEKLELPISGFRKLDDSTYINRGYRVFLMTNENDATYYHTLDITTGIQGIGYTQLDKVTQANGAGILRCIKE